MVGGDSVPPSDNGKLEGEADSAWTDDDSVKLIWQVWQDLREWPEAHVADTRRLGRLIRDDFKMRAISSCCSSRFEIGA